MGSLEEVPFVLEFWNWSLLSERAKPKSFFALVGFHWLNDAVFVMPN
jgi:hypothetical protein